MFTVDIELNYKSYSSSILVWTSVGCGKNSNEIHLTHGAKVDFDTEQD